MIALGTLLLTAARAQSPLSYFAQNWSPNRGACPFIRRFGRGGDGGKIACNIAPPKTNCLIVSVGSNNEFSFESAVHQQFPRCSIHTYDPTVREPRPPAYVTFHKTTVPRKLGGDVFILKMDCEGCEYTDLPPLSSKAQQILLEVHPCLTGSVSKDRALLGHLAKTHTLFSREHNRFGIRPGCMELSWIRFDLRRRK